ncbi:hypothetical protein BDF19DRAFT_450492 [Syncephalis fuscata]|nr:hypothetical protein BDF19DRAFT_450492 [Syncephalis fuscata]
MNEATATTFVRSLYRQLWRACKPAADHRSSGIRVLQGHVRHSFRETRDVTDPITREALLERGENTLKFLQSAAHKNSTEQQLVANLISINIYRNKYSERSPISRQLKPKEQSIHDDTYAAYDQIVAALNATFNLGLR